MKKINNMQKNIKKQLGIIWLRMVLVLPILAASYSMAASPEQEFQVEPGMYVLVSFSMNDHSLRNYFLEAEHYGAKLVLRGLTGEKGGRNRFADTRARIEKARINVEINPNLFEALNVKHVPVIVVVGQDKSIKQISGHITLQKALEMMEVEPAVVKQKPANR